MTKRTRSQSAFEGLNRTSGESSLAIRENIEQTIRDLHAGIQSKLKSALSNAIEIGRILSLKKNELPHGEFSDWIENANLGFELRQAQKYMRAFEYKDELLQNLKANSEFAFGNLNKALTLISDKSQPKEINNPLEIYKSFSSGKNLPRQEREILKKWLNSKLETFESKANKIRKDLKKL